MIQHTSRQAYYEIIDSLGHKQKMVYEALIILKSATNLMIAKYLNKPINTITPRCFELRQLKLVGVDKQEVDPNTKRKAIYWRCVK